VRRSLMAWFEKGFGLLLTDAAGVVVDAFIKERIVSRG